MTNAPRPEDRSLVPKPPDWLCGAMRQGRVRCHEARSTAVRPHIYLLILRPILPYRMFPIEGCYAGRFFNRHGHSAAALTGSPGPWRGRLSSTSRRQRRCRMVGFQAVRRTFTGMSWRHSSKEQPRLSPSGRTCTRNFRLPLKSLSESAGGFSALTGRIVAVSRKPHLERLPPVCV
jgi:hypothetical protein